MSPTIDFHAHIFPSPPNPLNSASTLLAGIRRRARRWLSPVTHSMHRVQTVFRHLPEPARHRLDAISALAPLPGLLVESTPQDLITTLQENGVDAAVVIAHPPIIPNEFVLEAARENPALIPFVNIPRGTRGPGTVLKRFAEEGARGLKIHVAADGDAPGAPRYRALLKAATDLGLPVILHTGCIHSKLLYRAPHLGEVEQFRPWFKAFPETRFILAHMNFHNPDAALELALEFPNLFVDTSWQPTETIAEAVRRIGPERVLFGSDWPLVGDNIAVGLQRITDGVDSGLLNSRDAELILGLNAEKLLKSGKSI